MTREDIRPGVKVKAYPPLQSDYRFAGRTGEIVGVTNDKFWVMKGTQVVVRYENDDCQDMSEVHAKAEIALGLKPLLPIRRFPYLHFYFAPEELEPA